MSRRWKILISVSSVIVPFDQASKSVARAVLPSDPYGNGIRVPVVENYFDRCWPIIPAPRSASFTAAPAHYQGHNGPVFNVADASLSVASLMFIAASLAAAKRGQTHGRVDSISR